MQNNIYKAYCLFSKDWATFLNFNEITNSNKVVAKKAKGCNDNRCDENLSIDTNYFSKITYDPYFPPKSLIHITFYIKKFSINFSSYFINSF